MQGYKEINNKHTNIFNKLLKISEEFEVFSFLNSNDFNQDKYKKYDWLAALGTFDSFKFCSKNNIKDFQHFLNKHQKEWKFLFISYDLKNSFENLSSNNIDNLDFADIYIFIPKFVIKSVNKIIDIEHHASVNKSEAESFYNKLNYINTDSDKDNNISLHFKSRINKETYLNSIENIRSDIKYGDIYEMNFCQEFFVEDIDINPLKVYKRLNKHSPAPFSAFFRENEHYVMSTSPERYIQKTANKIISQPIKGTAKRFHSKKDEAVKIELQNSIKERAENIMIVDLVRNDLSRIKNSSKVTTKELCEIYSFPHVHQMISTISAEIDINTSFSNIMEASFPMGSMTGAPKIKAMKLIEKYETSKRGLFSGSIGYIDKNGDFDFNVIIRSLLYNRKHKYLSLTTGGAITYLSKAEEEYQESLLKAQAIFDIFK